MNPQVLLVNMTALGAVPLPPHVASVSTLKSLSAGGQIVRSFARRLSLSLLSYFEDFSVLKPYGDVDTVILFDYKGMANACRQIDSVMKHGCRRVAFFWNVVDNAQLLKSIPDGWEIWTFDPADAKRFGIHLAGQFYFPELYTPGRACDYDLFFVGHDKGRQKPLKALEANLPADFRFENRLVKSRLKSKEYPYAACVEAASRSKAILDWVRAGQTGLSMRALEAPALGRKLVTNNPAVMDYALYNPSNTLVLTDMDTRKIVDFVNGEEPRWDETLLREFTFADWLRRNLNQ